MTSILLTLGLPSFNTVLANASISFANQWANCSRPNSIIRVMRNMDLIIGSNVCILPYFILFFLYITYMSVVCLFRMCIRMLVQSISVFLLAVFLWALLPETKRMMMMIKFYLLTVKQSAAFQTCCFNCTV